jgi:phosphinothricin acetyltransferase
MTTTIRPATVADLPAVTAIYNHAVIHTTAIWNDAVVDLENRHAWYETRRERGYPVLVAEIDGTIAGYGSFGDFRAFEGYRFSVEHSVYVAEAMRRRGVASQLLMVLIDEARRLGKHVMIAGVAADNDVSIRLHLRHGFVETARMPEVGIKFGRWLDLVFLQKTLTAG